jgi:hypothetical protein
MGGAYGEFLGFFPELIETFEIYTHEDDRVSGYKLTFEKKIQGIRQTTNEYIDMKRAKELPLLDIGQRYTFWSYTKLDIATEFVKIDDEYYRPMKTAQFNREGGFWETVLEKVVGNDGTKNETPELAEPEW